MAARVRVFAVDRRGERFHGPQEQFAVLLS